MSPTAPAQARVWDSWRTGSAKPQRWGRSCPRPRRPGEFLLGEGGLGPVAGACLLASWPPRRPQTGPAGRRVWIALLHTGSLSRRARPASGERGCGGLAEPHPARASRLCHSPALGTSAALLWAPSPPALGWAWGQETGLPGWRGWPPSWPVTSPPLPRRLDCACERREGALGLGTQRGPAGPHSPASSRQSRPRPLPVSWLP